MKLDELKKVESELTAIKSRLEDNFQRISWEIYQTRRCVDEAKAAIKIVTDNVTLPTVEEVQEIYRNDSTILTDGK